MSVLPLVGEVSGGIMRTIDVLLIVAIRWNVCSVFSYIKRMAYLSLPSFL